MSCGFSFIADRELEYQSSSLKDRRTERQDNRRTKDNVILRQSNRKTKEKIMY